MKVYIKAYGCQMNMRDSEAVSALLLCNGFTMTASEQEADILIINTCSVRGKAEDKAIGKLGLLAATKREHPQRVVGAMGCMVQRLQHEMFRRVRGLDFAVGTRAMSRLPQVLDSVLAGGSPVLDVAESEDDMEALSGHSATGISVFVNILFGCDRRCTYCIVPHVRGPERSRLGEDVVDEVRCVVAQGRVKEVTLLGQSVMSYGRRGDVWPAAYVSPRGYVEPLSRLLEAVAAIDGLRRVRFTSGHPSGVTPELVRAMTEIPEVCAHLHLPFQSGSDRILGLMKRGYTADSYRDAVKRLRDAIPDIALTTDVIVGFPSETVAEFEVTRAFMEEIGFDNAFIFKYSPRPGTKAAEMDDDVPDEEKARRNQVLLAEQDTRGLAINGRLVGSVQEVLVGGESLRNAERWSGRNGGNKIVVFNPVEGVEVGDIARVRIDRARAQTLYGEVVDDE